MLEQQCDEQPTDTAVPVEVGMDGLELNMCQPNANERRQAILRVKVLLEVRQERCQLLRGGGNESRAFSDPLGKDSLPSCIVSKGSFPGAFGEIGWGPPTPPDRAA